jgi:hypothetical protein
MAECWNTTLESPFRKYIVAFPTDCLRSFNLSKDNRPKLTAKPCLTFVGWRSARLGDTTDETGPDDDDETCPEAFFNTRRARKPCSGRRPQLGTRIVHVEDGHQLSASHYHNAVVYVCLVSLAVYPSCICGYPTSRVTPCQAAAD